MLKTIVAVFLSLFVAYTALAAEPIKKANKGQTVTKIGGVSFGIGMAENEFLNKNTSFKPEKKASENATIYSLTSKGTGYECYFGKGILYKISIGSHFSAENNKQVESEIKRLLKKYKANRDKFDSESHTSIGSISKGNTDIEVLWGDSVSFTMFDKNLSKNMP
jgi:hypothetical protein